MAELNEWRNESEKLIKSELVNGRRLQINKLV